MWTLLALHRGKFVPPRQKHVWRIFHRGTNVAKACLEDGPDFQMVFVPPPRSHISLVYVDKFMLELPFKIIIGENDNSKRYVL